MVTSPTECSARRQQLTLTCEEWCAAQQLRQHASGGPDVHGLRVRAVGGQHQLRRCRFRFRHRWGGLTSSRSNTQVATNENHTYLSAAVEAARAIAAPGTAAS